MEAGARKNWQESKDQSIKKIGDITTMSPVQKVEQAQSTNEEGVTNALIRVLMGKKTIYFMQGHGERSVDASGRDGFQDFPGLQVLIVEGLQLFCYGIPLG